MDESSIRRLVPLLGQHGIPAMTRAEKACLQIRVGLGRCRIFVEDEPHIMRTLYRAAASRPILGTSGSCQVQMPDDWTARQSSGSLRRTTLPLLPARGSKVVEQRIERGHVKVK